MFYILKGFICFDISHNALAASISNLISDAMSPSESIPIIWLSSTTGSLLYLLLSHQACCIVNIHIWCYSHNLWCHYILYFVSWGFTMCYISYNYIPVSYYSTTPVWSHTGIEPTLCFASAVLFLQHFCCVNICNTFGHFIPSNLQINPPLYQIQWYFPRQN